MSALTERCMRLPISDATRRASTVAAPRATRSRVSRFAAGAEAAALGMAAITIHGARVMLASRGGPSGAAGPAADERTGIRHAAQRTIEEVVRTQGMREPVPALGDDRHRLLAPQGQGVQIARERLQIELGAEGAYGLALPV